MKARSKNPIARRARAAGAAAVIAAGACAAQPPDTEELDASPGARPQIYDVEIVRDYPHDTTAFTQGLFFADGALYESTGHYGKSEVRRVNLRTGRVIKNARLPDHVFGEGSTRVGDRLISLTWRSGVGHIHDLETLSLEGTFEFAGEGWGLTFDGERLILSDGTPQLRFLDPDDFRTLATLDVTYLGQPISNLNELEWIDGEIWANVWRQDVIIRIDPGTGAVTGIVDLSSLFPPTRRADPADDVPNGIAYEPASGRLFVTGKRWPKIFELRLRARAAPDSTD